MKSLKSCNKLSEKDDEERCKHFNVKSLALTQPAGMLQKHLQKYNEDIKLVGIGRF